MSQGLGEIACASQRYGSDPQYVFGGGGNTSYKDENHLYVKPSGVSLATILPEQFVKMDRGSIRALFDAEIPTDVNAREAAVKDLMAAAVCPGSSGRPSVEAPMHELFPQTFVVHTHSTLLNGLTCSQQAKLVAGELFPDAMWVPYVDPGFTLSVTMAELINAYQQKSGKAPSVAIMQNHGLVVAADSMEEIHQIHDEMMTKLTAAYAEKGIALELEMLEPDDKEIHKVAPKLRTLLGQEREGPRAVVHASGYFTPAAGPLTPDHIVYAKSHHFHGEPTVDTLSEFNKHHGYDPIIVSISSQCVFAAEKSLKAARLAMDAAKNAALVLQYTAAFGGPRYLPEREYKFIENWEVENYRKKVSATASSVGRLEGKVALVTGAAQGFGYGIAQGMAAEGATIIIADINLEGAQKAADELNDEFGMARACAVAVNIADEDSVAAMADSVVKETGGLDILIANAGVLRAGSVKEISKKDWDFVTDVNYTGYFLCVKHLGGLMADQVVEGQGGWMDIIQINSKSGLQGSNKNGAYAGSKFGTIGLTQSFAMELVNDRIKVNSICPGNFFDGPLWSDEERGLFVQYLKAGKVPGAKTIADVRHFYESKVPMNRGCRPEDVLKAILYCVEQQYETGQAIPVTGGQVMLN